MFSLSLLATAPLIALPPSSPAEPSPISLSSWSLPAEGEKHVGGPPAGVAPAQPGDVAPREPYRLATVERDVSAARLEMAGITALVMVPRLYSRSKGSSAFRFRSDGWFGRDTYALGVDKLLHGWKAYVYTDLIQSAIARRIGDGRSAAITSGIFGFGLTTLAEISDGFSASTGFSYEDETAHVVGTGLSVARNIVPGLRNKLDFRLGLTPRLDGALFDARRRQADSTYFLALQLAGFHALERSPLRFAELHLGYYARGFSDIERERGDPLRRRALVGIGFNVQQLFARHPRSTPERWAKGTLDYLQVPYTAIHS